MWSGASSPPTRPWRWQCALPCEPQKPRGDRCRAGGRCRWRGPRRHGQADGARQEDGSERPARLPDRARLAGTEAEQLVAQNLVPAATSNVVPQSTRTLAPVSEPRLDAASETTWYPAASPNRIDTIEYAYLEGQQGAYIQTRNGFDVDGVEIKCRLDFGAKGRRLARALQEPRRVDRAFGDAPFLIAEEMNARLRK